MVCGGRYWKKKKQLTEERKEKISERDRCVGGTKEGSGSEGDGGHRRKNI